jgi:membrane-bound lytic murein transglycosylase F
LIPNKIKWLGLLLLPALMLAADCFAPEEPEISRLESIQRHGSLVMLTRNSASTYFLDAEGETGPEYELVRAFADHLGVDLKVRVADSFSDLSTLLEQGEGDLIAANLTRTPQRELQFRFGPDYAETTTLVVFRRDLPRPRSIQDLVGLNMAVIGSSSYDDLLMDHASTLPQLQWEAREGVGMEDLLLAIDHGELDATLVDASIFSINRQFYPSVVGAFELQGKQPQAWAFVRDDDDSLSQQAEQFLHEYRSDGRLAALRERFYTNQDRLDYVGMFHFMHKVRERLPSYMDTFQQVATDRDVDWRLLAAMGYQESHWDPQAASPTGVRGLMMLTLNTASLLGLDNRLDPTQSIEGGARYFQRMHAKIPARIAEPDRTWMVLAAYNMGWGHLEDARVLAQRAGGNPDRWDDVEKALPLLTQEPHYRTTRYGYARGHEAQRYVSNIREYWEILKWMDTREHPLLVAQETTLAP